LTVNAWVSALLGQTIGDYQVDSYVGGGSFGLVFEVTKLSNGSRFAMKVLVPSGNAQAASEFDAEGVLLQKLVKCSGVITWVDSGTAMLSLNLGGAQVQLPFGYRVMALASAALEELVLDPARRVAVPWQERLSHWRGAIRGVHQMHLNNVAHRDLKASNCLVMLHGRETEIRIGDLGRSKDFTDPASQSLLEYAFGRGDPRFAPPEHLWFQGGSAAVDFKNADLYGLGSLFAELATGHPMTALAIGSSWDLSNARHEGARDYRKGFRRDLAALRPKFHRAIEQMALDLPPAIRHDAVQLLRQLCDPVPSERQPKRMRGKRHVPDPGLLWLLRRADILSRRLSVEARTRHQAKKTKRRSAS
jgi:serine/threonine protein kinase